MLKKLLSSVFLLFVLVGCSEPQDPLNEHLNQGNFELIKFNQSVADSKALLGSFGVEVPTVTGYELRAWEGSDRVIVISFLDDQAKHKSYSVFANEQVTTTEVIWDEQGNEQRNVEQNQEYVAPEPNTEGE